MSSHYLYQKIWERCNSWIRNARGQEVTRLYFSFVSPSQKNDGRQRSTAHDRFFLSITVESSCTREIDFRSEGRQSKTIPSPSTSSASAMASTLGCFIWPQRRLFYGVCQILQIFAVAGGSQILILLWYLTLCRHRCSVMFCSFFCPVWFYVPYCVSFPGTLLSGCQNW